MASKRPAARRKTTAGGIKAPPQKKSSSGDVKSPTKSASGSVPAPKSAQKSAKPSARAGSSPPGNPFASVKPTATGTRAPAVPVADKRTSSAGSTAAPKATTKTSAAKPAHAVKPAPSRAKPTNAARAAQKTPQKAANPRVIPAPPIAVAKASSEEYGSVAPPPPEDATLSGMSADAFDEVTSRIADIVDDVERASDDPDARRRATHALDDLSARIANDDAARSAESVIDTFSSGYYFRQWGRAAMRGRAEEVDDFGFDPTYESRYRSLLDGLYKSYFRVQASGLEHIPPSGRALLVANHGGALPWDGLMLRTALRLESSRELRWLTEDFLFHMPFLGARLNRLGAVRANQENAERLLDQEKLVAVFPEGTKGIGKLHRDRYKLQRFGRGGYIKLALRTRTPIIPTAIVGAEDAYPILMNAPYLQKLLRVPYVPVTPLFPLLGPVGLLPLPSKWRIVLGEPIDLNEHLGDDAESAVGSSRVDLQACKLEYSIVSPK